MFDEKLLESAEFYDRRYRNFATLVIVPLFALFIFLVIFSVFGKREITVKSVGRIVPRRVMSVVQSTSNNPIELNNLKENKRVNKGDILITYRDNDEKYSRNLLNSQLKIANDRLDALDTYRKSIESGVSQFLQPDPFGYSDLFENYLSQVNTLNDEYTQQVKDKAASDNQIETQKNALNEAAEQNLIDISQYETVLNAVKLDDSSGLSENKYAYIYDDYVANSKGLTGYDNEKAKQNTSSIVHQAINQLHETATNYQTQSRSLRKTADISMATTKDKEESLKTYQLSSATTDYADQKSTVDKIKAQISSAESDVENNVLHAGQSGILHVLSSNTRHTFVAKGSEVAEIYPNLSANPEIDVEFMIPADKISGIKKRERVRFRLSKSLSKPIIISGNIRTVDTSATSTKQGNYFKVVASVNLSEDDYKQVKYGTEGTVTIITGKKTWFSYVKDQMFKD